MTTTTNINLIQAIVDGIITPEQALALQNMGVDTAIPGPKAPKASKAPKAPKVEKQAKAQEPAKIEQPKAEDSPKEPVYTKRGCILQWGDGITAKGKEKATITKAYNSLVAQGFAIERKRCGTWVQLYQAKDNKRPCKEFAAAKLDQGWTLIKGAWTYVDLLKGYEDSFRPEEE